MKVNLKNFGIEAESDLEGIANNLIDKSDHDWDKKYKLRHKTKKEMMELRHKIKMDEKKNSTSVLGYINKKKEMKQKLQKEKEEREPKRVVRIIDIALFFIYGIVCILAFKELHVGAAVIGIIQMICVTLSLFSTLNLISLFEKDYKVLLLISVLLIVPWFAFVV